jgi:outer membrane protein assembly factor BamD (BamD/ComL family)
MKKTTMIVYWLCFVIFTCAGAVSADVVVLSETGREWVKVSDLPKGLVAVQKLLDEGSAKKAYKQVKKWIKANEDSEVLDQALFLKAQAQFDRKLYYQSFVVYEEMLDGWGASSLFEAALHQQMEIARRFLAGEKRKVWGFIPASARTEGLEILDRVVERWPGSELAAQALMMQADYYYDRGRFIEAQMTYQIVVENYTKSGYYEKALLRNAESTHAQYRGPLYDSGCLTEARLRYEQYRSRYPQRGQELGIAQRIQRIRWQEAEKHSEIADFYQRTKQQRASEYYQDYIQDHWRDTEWAKEN